MAAAGVPSLLGPTNQETGASDPSSRGADADFLLSPMGPALYRIPSELNARRNIESLSSFLAFFVSPFAYRHTNSSANY